MSDRVGDLRRAQWRGTLALAGRETRRVLIVWTQTILPPVLNAFLFLLVFGGALGGRIRQIEGLPYLTFILPGLVVMTVANQSFGNNATSIFQAKREGYIEDILTSPLRPWQLAAGYLSGGLLRATLTAGIVVLVGSAFAGGVANPLLAVLALTLTGFVFASLGIVAGIWADTFDQFSLVANLIIAPLALVGGVFYAAGNLPQPWATLTRLDPIYYLVDAARAGFTGFHESSVAASLLVATVVAAGLFALAVILLARGWRLKP